MSGDPANLIMVQWSVIQAEGGAFVCEFTDGQLSITYGPMPAGITDKFIAERRRSVSAIFDRAIERTTNG